jgi:hypothetical protein
MRPERGQVRSGLMAPGIVRNIPEQVTHPKWEDDHMNSIPPMSIGEYELPERAE